MAKLLILQGKEGTCAFHCTSPIALVSLPRDKIPQLVGVLY